MQVLRVLKRVVLVVMIGWIVGCVLSFLSGFLLTFLPIPWGLPLPWSDFNDFVETSDGRVFVSVRFYNRALCYDRSGRLLAAHRFPYGAKNTRLAADQAGRVYCRTKNRVYTYSSDWELLSVAEADAGQGGVWELSRDSGWPVHAPQRSGEAMADRPLSSGDLLFVDEEERREVFRCSDGSVLRRVGNSLERVSPQGEVVATYGTPWPLRPFVFPFPACIAWASMFVLPILFLRPAPPSSPGPGQ